MRARGFKPRRNAGHVAFVGAIALSLSSGEIDLTLRGKRPAGRLLQERNVRGNFWQQMLFSLYRRSVGGSSENCADRAAHRERATTAVWRYRTHRILPD